MGDLQKQDKRGGLIVYADDFLGASPNIVDDVSRALLGPSAISEDGHKRKTTMDPGNEDRTMTALGWDVSLTRRSVRPARKTMLKKIAGFLGIDLSQPVSVRDIQRLSSFAQHDGVIYPELKILNGDLYQMLEHRHYSVALRDAERWACEEGTSRLPLAPSWRTT